MKTQTEMFDNVSGIIRPKDVCAGKHGGNPLSTAAFESIKDHLSIGQQMILFFLEPHKENGLTVDQLSQLMDKTPNAISGRITELRMKGLIKQNGTRKTRSGCNAAVWIVAE